MSLSELTSREAVLSAMAECDELGRDAFLAKYGFGRAKKYMVRHAGVDYDIRALAFIAYQFQFPDREPLSRTRTASGTGSTVPAMERLGFQVISVADGNPTGCPFCRKLEWPTALVAENERAVAFLDEFPVSKGHTLVVPRDHVSRLEELEPTAWTELFDLVRHVAELAGLPQVIQGLNIGVNDGKAAGQTVDHAHVHVIPRRTGDVKDPRVGVRWGLPETADYWCGA